MARIFGVVTLCMLIICGCSKKTPEASLPENFETAPVADFTVTPSPTITATPRYFRWGNELVQFNDMAIISDDEVWAVGQRGLIIHDYPEYRALKSDYEYPGKYPFTSGSLWAVVFISPEDGWMIGTCSVFHWDGQSWTEATPKNLPFCPLFSDIDFTSENDGWLSEIDESGNHVALYHWNGMEWKKIHLIDEIGRDDFQLVTIDALSAKEVWAAGYETLSYPPKGVVIRWDGVHWKEVPTLEDMDSIKSISAIGTNDVWAANGGSAYHWDGTAWKVAEQFKRERGVRSDFDNVTVKAITSENVWIGTFNLLAHWNGKIWEEVPYDQYQGRLDIVDIDASPEGGVYALTRSGTILRLDR